MPVKKGFILDHDLAGKIWRCEQCGRQFKAIPPGATILLGGVQMDGLEQKASEGYHRVRMDIFDSLV